ncbi:MAG TPA: hypothetical protein VL853_00270 [Gemmatimonadales bacterium]|jgi:hypothetical protein|nr:hypothetical protein [Gemmatimonadales bacterium]
MEQKIRDSAGQELELSYDPRCCIHTPECIPSLSDFSDAQQPPRIEAAGTLADPTPAPIEPRSS